MTGQCGSRQSVPPLWQTSGLPLPADGDYNVSMEMIYTDQSETGFLDQYLPLYEAIAEKTAATLALAEEYQLGVVAITPDQIHLINRDYRNVDRPTDVISFALQDDPDGFRIPGEPVELGDIFINVEAVKNQARDYGHSEKREAGFLFCHGLLHLRGYDHMKPEDESVMFGLQKEILHGLADQ